MKAVFSSRVRRQMGAAGIFRLLLIAGWVLAANPAFAFNEGQTSSIAHVFAGHGFTVGFLVVLLGGLALNLTPCVYPLIGVTVAYFGNEGGGTRRTLALATLYVFGIALTFSVVGVSAALSGSLFGSALQNPWVLVSIAAMLLLLAASSFGLFSLQPPQWLMRRVGPSRPGYLGSLTMGLGMGVVAAPCIGPVVLGLLLMVQRSGNPFFGFALFFTLAIGMGIPYLGLAVAAGRIRSLPRSGAWLAWVEQLFGFVLIGLALYFLDPLTPNRILTRLLPYYGVAAGLYLAFFAPIAREWPPFMAFRWGFGSVCAVVLVYLIWPHGPRPILAFQPFDSALLKGAANAHKPVVVDFMADWCVPCREMEHQTFTDPAVVKDAARFVRLRANMTAENAQNAALMKQFNVQGVPTLLFIGPNGKVSRRRIGFVGPAEFIRLLNRAG